ncbi:MAG: shikimate dehydrogenase, partial [Gammaproteobacteria bacterium]
LDAFALASERSARAQAAGAANVLAFEGDQVRADNTDGAGLVRDVEMRLGLPLGGRLVLILGAGGAARGVIHPLLEAGVARVTIANRDAGRARELARQVGDPRVRGGGFGLASDALASGEHFDLLVNATSIGLAGERLPLPVAMFEHARLAFDMCYAARPTPFVAQAAEAGCAASDGLGMLVEQAAESFLIWRGVRPETASVYEALRAELLA